MWHCLGTLAPAQTQLHTQVAAISTIKISRTCQNYNTRHSLVSTISQICRFASWLLPGTISWCCLSAPYRLQHQWFCCRRWPLISRTFVRDRSWCWCVFSEKAMLNKANFKGLNLQLVSVSACRAFKDLCALNSMTLMQCSGLILYVYELWRAVL